jgi:hypothetical protein
MLLTVPFGKLVVLSKAMLIPGSSVFFNVVVLLFEKYSEALSLMELDSIDGFSMELLSFSSSSPCVDGRSLLATAAPLPASDGTLNLGDSPNLTLSGFDTI